MQSISFDLNQKGVKEQKRWGQLLKYPGPDNATVELLKEHADHWFENPSTFWAGGQSLNMSEYPAAAQILGCFLWTESDTA